MPPRQPSRRPVQPRRPLPLQVEQLESRLAPAAPLGQPFAAFTPVTPNPRNVAVSSIALTFSEAVTGFDLADLQLTRNGTPVPLTGAALSTADNVTWTLDNLDGLTGFPDAADTYALTLVAAGSGITDANSNPLLDDAGTSFVVLDPAVFQLQGTTLTVPGTPGDDAFSFTAGPTAHLAFNGASFAFDPAAVTAVHFPGNGGQDRASVTGAGGESTSLLPLQVTLTGPGYAVYVAYCADVTVFSGGGAATADFGTSAQGTDVFVGTPGYSEASGSGYRNVAAGFATAHASAGGPNAVADLLTGAGADQYTVLPGQSSIAGAGYAVGVIGFAWAAAWAAGPSAVADLATPAGAATFGGRPTFSYVSDAASISYAVGFARVRCYAEGPAGNARAEMDTTAGADSLVGSPNFSTVSGGGYSNTAVNFYSIAVWANGASPAAALTTGAGADQGFVATPGFGYISGPGYVVYAAGFATLTGNSGGGESVAYLKTTAGSDTVEGGQALTSVTGAGYVTTARAFNSVVVTAGGPASVAYLTTSAGSDRFTGGWLSSSIQGASYFVSVLEFATVTATASSSSSVANLYDSVRDDTFTGQGSQALLTGPGFSVQGTGFGFVGIHSTAGGTDRALVDAIDYTLNKVGPWL
jgi:hypothetical protein